MSAPRSDRGTRREHIQRKQRKKPMPLWLRHTLRAGILLGLGAGMVGGIAHLWTGGWVMRQTDRLEQAWLRQTAAAGLVAGNVFVTGREQTSSAEIALALDLGKDMPLLAFDPASARKHLEKLTWVRQARVERRFPNTILISLAERQPVGFYQQNGKLSLVDDTAAVLTTEGLSRWTGLPVLVGAGSPQAAPALLARLGAYPDIAARVKALTFLNQRRWTLRLHNNIDVLLPEGDVADALERLQSAHDDGRLLDRDIQSVDLRQKDRMVITPTPAAVRREAAPKERI